MIYIQFILGCVVSKLSTRASKNFLTFLVVLFSGLFLYVGGELSMVYRLLPGYFSEWSELATWDTASQFVSYWGLFSIFLLFQAGAAAISKAAFLSAYHLKAIHGTTIVPKC